MKAGSASCVNTLIGSPTRGSRRAICERSALLQFAVGQANVTPLGSGRGKAS
jgi:hypothetical protein